ncbi:hypothetical protein CHR90_00545 [Elstera cyanobacteriorum]|uniref:diguanylate cyclase n=2 Tax=Elstera cyanobacteriorum TaxID=2022747 RepID=A0A255XZC6_9PROT|nr:hypothetical protein CHR90_00545 [Elstera cyanobacteriorum]
MAVRTGTSFGDTRGRRLDLKGRIMPALHFARAPWLTSLNRPQVVVPDHDAPLRQVLSEMGYQCAPSGAAPEDASACLAEFRDLSTQAHTSPKPPLPRPVLYTASEETVTARLAALRSGGQGLLTRPYHSDDIDRLLKQCARRSGATRTARRLVMVEDDRSMARLVASYLLPHGYEVHHVQNPTQVLEALASLRPALLLLDLNLPDVSGAEIATIIRQFPAFMTLPILFLSGETSHAAQIAALRCGADGFVTKPVRAEDLLGRVDAALTRLEELDQLAHSDLLTDLPNRRAFMLEFDHAQASVNRTGRPHSLAVIDIDRFKSINDTYGHLAGDRVLRRVAGYLRTSLRREDYLARIGGEEFAIILPGADVHEAKQVLDSVREACAPACEDVIPQPISFSGGLVSLTARRGETAETHIKRADDCLYRAKNTGRNRILIEEDPD